MAVLRGDALLDYAIWRPGLPDGVGDIHRGRIAAIMPAMGGAFVALAEGDGFLPDSEGAKGLTEGIVLRVRVTRAALGGKGPRLSARFTAQEDFLAASGAVGLISRGAGALARFAAIFPEAAIFVDDPAVAALVPRSCTIVAQAFDDDIESQVEALSAQTVTLPGGARLAIYSTPALVAIDTDTGGRQDSQVAVNRSVIPALAREIRLRNLSGAIVVDLAGLPIRKRTSLGPAIASALADDPLKPRFLGFTALGLAEILRTRIHPPLHELLAGPHAAGLVALRQVVRDLDPDPRRLPALRAAPSVVEALRRDPVALPDLARRAGQNLMLRSDPSLAGSDWRLEQEHG